jgi:hypothetical protein
MHPRVLFLTMLLAAALSACSRSVPSHLPRTSPASAEARCARPSTRCRPRRSGSRPRSRRSTPSRPRATRPGAPRGGQPPELLDLGAGGGLRDRAHHRRGDRARAPRPPRAPPAPARAPRRRHRPGPSRGPPPVTPEALALEAMTEARRSRRASTSRPSARTSRPSRGASAQPRRGMAARHHDGRARRAGRQPMEIGGGARVTLPIFDQRRGATAAYGAQFDARWSATTPAPWTCARPCATPATGCARRTPARGSTTP